MAELQDLKTTPMEARRAKPIQLDKPTKDSRHSAIGLQRSLPKPFQRSPKIHKNYQSTTMELGASSEKINSIRARLLCRTVRRLTPDGLALKVNRAPKLKSKTQPKGL